MQLLFDLMVDIIIDTGITGLDTACGVKLGFCRPAFLAQGLDFTRVIDYRFYSFYFFYRACMSEGVTQLPGLSFFKGNPVLQNQAHAGFVMYRK